MKPLRPALCLLCLSAAFGLAQTEPLILSVRPLDTETEMRVRVEAGFTLLRLETKEELAEGGTWIPRATRQLSGHAGVVSLRVDSAALDHCFRVLCFTAEELDSELFAGAPFALEAAVPDQVVGEQQTREGNPPPTADFAAPGTTEQTAEDPDANTDPNREVLDVDLWAARSNRVYVFNQYRGLQIVDVTDPDAAVLVGELPMAARGERMVLLDGPYALLLLDPGCTYSAERESEAVVVSLAGDDPREVARFPIGGYIREARLVGSALYVLTHAVDRADGRYRSITVLSTHDLTDPTRPVAVARDQQDGYSRFVHATSDRMVVGSGNGSGTLLRVHDISSPTGALARMGDVGIPGRVEDEYKVWIEGDLLASISQDRATWSTVLRTHRLGVVSTNSPDLAGGAEQLGSVSMALNERLFGTRFGPDRIAYIVTFQRIDPLWIVDFSNPRAPTILGELEVPGFSTYLQPLADGELLSIGTESGKVAVSLFDVSDPADPKLASRVRLGDRWSYSEAVYEEKAFQVLPSANAVLVPYASGGEQGVQFIDLLPGNLVERGFLPIRPTPRRTRLLSDRFYAVNAERLAVIDATDRDEPRITHEVDLAQPVNSVHLDRGYRVEVGQAAGTASIRVALWGSDEILGVLDLPARHRVLGRSHRPGQLDILAQVQGTNEVVHHHIDLSDLPNLLLSSSAPWPINGESYHAAALRPRDGLVVWAYDSFDGWWGGGGPELGFVDIWLPPNRRLLAVRLDRERPEIVSDVRLPKLEVEGWDFDPKFHAAAGKVYASRQSTHYLPMRATDAEDPDMLRAAQDIVAGGDLPYIAYNMQTLSVLDYADPAMPTARPNLPLDGNLAGVSGDGFVLYTVSNRDPDTGRTGAASRLAACAYDGVAIYPLDAFDIGEVWGHTGAAVRDRDLLVVVREPDAAFLQPLRLRGRSFVAGDPQPLGRWASALTWRNDMLALRSDGGTQFFELSDPMAPSALKLEPDQQHCYGHDLPDGDGETARGWITPAGIYGSIRFE